MSNSRADNFEANNAAVCKSESCAFTSVNSAGNASTMSTDTSSEKIIVALDCNLDEARVLAKALQGKARWLKIGMTLFYQEGPSVVQEFKDMGYKVFVDLKLHDIPHQVMGAAKAVVESGADMFTVHASGGLDMMQAAVDGAYQGHEARKTHGDITCLEPIILGVTVLTSLDQQALQSIGIERPVEDQVSLLAQLAMNAGLSGLVCSPLEAATLRSQLGLEPVIVTPGVRMPTDNVGDQARIMTPTKALASGASYLVIGRPVTKAECPAEAFLHIVSSIQPSSSA